MPQVHAANNAPIIPGGVKELKFVGTVPGVKVLKVEAKGAAVTGLQDVADGDVIFVLDAGKMYNVKDISEAQIQEALNSTNVSELTSKLQKMSA